MPPLILDPRWRSNVSLMTFPQLDALTHRFFLICCPPFSDPHTPLPPLRSVLPLFVFRQATLHISPHKNVRHSLFYPCLFFKSPRVRIVRPQLHISPPNPRHIKCPTIYTFCCDRLSSSLDFFKLLFLTSLTAASSQAEPPPL